MSSTIVIEEVRSIKEFDSWITRRHWVTVVWSWVTVMTPAEMVVLSWRHRFTSSWRLYGGRRLIYWGDFWQFTGVVRTCRIYWGGLVKSRYTILCLILINFLMMVTWSLWSQSISDLWSTADQLNWTFNSKLSSRNSQCNKQQE